MTWSMSAAAGHSSECPAISVRNRLAEQGFAALGLLAVAAMAVSLALPLADVPSGEPADSGRAAGNGHPVTGREARPSGFGDRETVAAAYAGAPLYHRSDLALTRPDGTDMTLKRLGWDGDAFYFPIDGGARVIRWNGTFGWMVDFMHNKAIARLGKGGHGRKISNGVIDTLETEGTLAGKPAPSPLRMTDLFDRLEFTHGHNTLMLTGLARLMPFATRIRPYVGIGAGIAFPHVEVRFTGEKQWTNQYQYAGPSFQLMAGLEVRSGRGSYFVEYKFMWASIDVALTNAHSWSLKKLKSPWLPRWLIEPFAGITELPGDLWDQFVRWRGGDAAPHGRIRTELSAHTVVIGGGYVWPGVATVPAPEQAKSASKAP